MNNAIRIQELLKLSVAERILIIQQLWDSIDPSDLKLSEAQKRELDKRLDKHRGGKTGFHTWDEIKKFLRPNYDTL